MKLKPCPFCGGEAEVHEEEAWGSPWLVECHNDCKIQPKTLWHPTGELAITAWNKRAKE